MAKVTFTDKVDSITNAIPEINKVDATTLNELKNSINAFYDAIGWMSYEDTVNTELNKQSLPEDITTTITIVDSSPIEVAKPIAFGDGDLWVGNKITPMAAFDTYIVRIDFKASISAVTGYFDIKLDIDGEIGEILTRNNTFPKGANVTQSFSITFNIYAGETFLTNGGEIKIRPSDDMLIWDKVVMIQRVYARSLFV